MQRDGLTGRAEEVLPGLDHATSTWLNQKLTHGEDWEKGPYYLKGLAPLAFALDDRRLKDKAAIWIEAIISSQKSDGYYGPRNDDWWPRMVVNYMLRDYCEATADERIPRFLAAYYAHLQKRLPSRPLKEWGRARAGDEIDTIFWLYNRGGDQSLLKLADLLYAQAYPWREIFTNNSFLSDINDFHPRHAVNVAQALKAPAVYWQRSKAPVDRDAYRAAIRHLATDHGTSFGINTGTEFLSGRSTVEGVELCAIAEKMLSAATVMRITGDAAIGDELELLAFNALPAALSKSFRQHVYYTLANNIAAKTGIVGYEVDYADGRTPAPRSGCPCCCYNLHMAWPKLVQNAWAATPNGGLATLAYIPSEVSAQVARGNQARIVCTTNYPFEDSISLAVHVDRSTQFPLYLRMPEWCKNPSVRINGVSQSCTQPNSYLVIDREWSDGDSVALQFAMPLSTNRGANNSVSIHRGPLVYSLAMEEKWMPIDPGKQRGYESFQVTSPTPWNFALDVAETNPGASIQVVYSPISRNPFETGEATPRLKVSAKKIVDWKLRADGLVSLDPPVSPVRSEAGLETIELVPFGSQMLRITDFPVLGEPQAPPRQWHDRFADGVVDDWLIYRGGFLRDQQLHLAKGAKAVVGGVEFSDVRFQASVQVGNTGDAGIIFRVTEPSIGIDHYKGYYVGIDAAAQSVIVGKADNRWIPVGREPAPISAGKPHRLKVQCQGATIKVWLDQHANPILEIHEPTFSSGMIGVRSFAPQATFARISAESIVS
jgi:hypothetical protein